MSGRGRGQPRRGRGTGGAAGSNAHLCNDAENSGGRGRGRELRQGGLEREQTPRGGNEAVHRVGRSRVWRNGEEALESKFGFDVYTEGEPRLGWLVTLASSTVEDQDSNQTFSCVDLYFMCQ
eukprot:c29780_g1_i1 orf=381-746(+)